MQLRTLEDKVSVAKISEKYDVCVDYVYGMANECEYVFSEDGTTYVNEREIVRRRHFHNHVKDTCQQHFFLLNRYFNVSEIAWMLNRIDKSSTEKTWIFFMNETLFRVTDDSSIFAYKIKRLMWKFFRYTRWLLMGIFRLGSYKYGNVDIRELNYKLVELDEKKEKDNGTPTH